MQARYLCPLLSFALEAACSTGQRQEQGDHICFCHSDISQGIPPPRPLVIFIATPGKHLLCRIIKELGGHLRRDLIWVLGKCLIYGKHYWSYPYCCYSWYSGCFQQCCCGRYFHRWAPWALDICIWWHFISTNRNPVRLITFPLHRTVLQDWGLEKAH